LQKIRTITYSGFANFPQKFIAAAAGTGWRDAHSSPAQLFTSHSRRSLELYDLRCGDAADSIGRTALA